MPRRVVVCSLGGERRPLELPGSQFASENKLITGGERSLYELAVAGSCAGWEVELRGAINEPIFRTICSAAGAAPVVGLEPRRPRVGEIVVVPEVADHALLAALRLSGAATVMDLLAPPGLWGWSFLPGWILPDPYAVDMGAIGTAASFTAIHDFGIRMWSPSYGAALAGTRAGVPVEWIGTGTPVAFPVPPSKTVDVAVIEHNRWHREAEEILGSLEGVSVLRIPKVEDQYSLCERLAPARILVWPSRIEGMSRIAREARAVGTVPVALDTNPFVTEEDHGGGVVLVSAAGEIAAEVLALLRSPDRLAKLGRQGAETSRLQTAWQPYVERVNGALQEVASMDRPGALSLGAVGDSLWEQLRRVSDHTAELESRMSAIDLLTAQAKLAGDEHARADALEGRLRELNSELESARRQLAAYRARLVVRILDMPPLALPYRLLRSVLRRLVGRAV